MGPVFGAAGVPTVVLATPRYDATMIFVILASIVYPPNIEELVTKYIPLSEEPVSIGDKIALTLLVALASFTADQTGEAEPGIPVACVLPISNVKDPFGVPVVLELFKPTKFPVPEIYF